jgi:hypothetical protein
MKTSHLSVTATLLAGALAIHASAASAALPDYGLISGAGALNTSTQWTYDNTLVSVSGTGYTASAQTDYGINQATSGTTSNTLAYAGSLWWDQYTISGGSGTGTAGFTAALDGSLASSGLAGAGVGYALVISSSLPTSYSIDFSTLTATNTSTWLNTQLAAFEASTGAVVLASYVDGVALGADKLINQSFAGNFDFTYGTSFYIGAVLLTGAGGNSGTSDFFNTATFNLGLSGGDTVVMASSVPEPGEWAMLLAGLGLIGLRLKGRRQRIG